MSATELPRSIPIRPAHREDAVCAGAESFALMVLGNAMLPEFAEGEIIVIEPGGMVTGGSHVLARVADAWLLRCLVRDARGWFLRALDPAYPDIAIEDLQSVRGLVIQRVRPGRRSQTKHYLE